MAVHLEPQDEYTHRPGPEPNFNESMYFNAYDPARRIGGFFRVGNRVNQAMAEMTICLYLPDGRVAFMFGRPRIDSNVVLEAGGMRFDVVRPFEELRVSYRGPVVLLAEPLDMADPKRAFTDNPSTSCTVELTYTGTGPMVGGESDEIREQPGEEFAKAHYEQLVRASGTLCVGSDTWEFDGFGLRDHSWGPRSWQAPWYYRWLTGNVGPDFGFMGSRIARREGQGIRGGFLWDGTTLHVCDRFEITTQWAGDDRYHAGLSACLGSGGREWRVAGRVLRLIPLRNRRDGLVTRISEGLTEWTLDDGRVGYGLSEYLDQIVDGVPVGITE